MRPDRVAAAAVAAFAAAVVAVGLAVPAIADDAGPSATATTSASPTASATETVVEIDDATLRWGLNNESSNRAFAPRTYNFFSAGTVPDPGEGGTTLPESEWHQVADDVEIQKWNGSAWKAATWAGLSTDSNGDALGSPTAGTFSNHRFVFGAGSGTVDAAAGTAHVEWTGSVTVLYYSGMSFFTLADPVLDVADGHGTLTATASGYASSVDDPTSWEPVPAATVTLADLPDVTLDETGLTATPAYRGVTVTGVGQVSGGDDFGAFPQSFVDYMFRLGTAAFWLSSGASTDPFKVPLPLTVGFGSGVEPVEPTPSAEPTKEPLDNPVVAPPVTVTVTPTQAPLPQPVAPVVPPATAPPAPVLPTASAGVGSVPAATQLVAAPLDAPAPAAASSATNRVWWLGGALLLAAALTLLVPVGRPRRP